MKAKTVAVVTGGSNGIGLATVEALQQKGVTVYELSRRAQVTHNAHHIVCDVTDAQAVCSAVNSVLQREGQIDVIVCNAGFGISGAVEFTDIADAERQFDVNFFGVVNTVKATLPQMRAQCRGRIVIVSSVAGAIAIPFQTFYSASKAALNAYAIALANEVRPFGVTVTAVMPGDISTGFTAARNKSALGDKEYGGRISKSVSKMEHDEQHGMQAAVAGKYICKQCLKKRVKPLSAIGLSYKFLCVLAKVLPQRLVSRIVYSIYAK